MSKGLRQHFCSLILCAFTVSACLTGLRAAEAEAVDYLKVVAAGNAALKAGKHEEALRLAEQAVQQSSGRFEAHVLKALVYGERGQGAEAKKAIASALSVAPETKKAKLLEIQAIIDRQIAQHSASPNATTGSLTGEARRKLDVLRLIAEDADKAKSAEERRKLVQEYLDKSEDFIKAQTNNIPVWTLRAAIGLELNRPKIAWEAGRRLIALGADSGDNAGVRKVLAQLDRKGWLGAQPPDLRPKAGTIWDNSLGMKFKKIASILNEAQTEETTFIFASIWETRVRDFEAFVAATGHEQRSHTWKEPGFDQTLDHPVCGVNWFDAVKFCEWLTQTERAAGLLDPQDEYRLPTDGEWSILAGSDKYKYPWGNDWPPPQGAGNYADASSDLNPKIENYRDGFNRTAPVGSFNPNPFGLYDVGGNLGEWCSDWYRKEMNSQETRKEIPALDDDGDGAKYRVLRGACWSNDWAVVLSSAYRVGRRPGLRVVDVGFRCVLVVGSGAPKF